MRTLIFSLLVLTGSPFGDLSRSAPAEFRAEAQPASVELTPLPDDDRPVRLPVLAFPVRVEPACAGEAEPRSLTISVADTRLHFTAAELSGVPVIEAMLTIPVKQLGPVRIDAFCRAGKDDGPARFLLEDAYTARLSLRCGPDEQATIVYATLPLDVDLACRRTEAAETAPDQDSVSLEPSESF